MTASSHQGGSDNGLRVNGGDDGRAVTSSTCGGWNQVVKVHFKVGDMGRL